MISKYKEILSRYPWPYDVRHTARSLYFHRWYLVIDGAGGSRTVTSARTKKELVSYRKKYYPDRPYRIIDHWKCVPKQLLEDCKFFMKYFKFSRYSSIHKAPYR